MFYLAVASFVWGVFHANQCHHHLHHRTLPTSNWLERLCKYRLKHSLIVSFVPEDSIIMPKEKATRKTKASKAETGGKRKKGNETRPLDLYLLLNAPPSQIPMRPSVVFLPTCSSPTTIVTLSAKKIRVSPLVSASRSSSSHRQYQSNHRAKRPSGQGAR